MSQLAVQAMADGVSAVGEERAADYAIDFRSAYHTGRIGMPFSSVPSPAIMSDTQTKAAYELGVADREATKPKTTVENTARNESAAVDSASAGTLDMFEDTEGILTDEELEVMHTHEREDATSPEFEASESERSSTENSHLDPAELQRRRKLAEAEKTDTAKSGVMEGVSRKDIRIAELLSKVFRRKVLFVSANFKLRGKTDGGVIYVNAKWGNVASQILAHELTHTAEASKYYGDLLSSVKKLYAAEKIDWNRALDDMLADKTYQEQYESEGRVFDKHAAERELVARKLEEVLGDETKLTQFAKDNRNWATRTLAWIRNKLRGFADLRLSADEYEAVQLMRDVEKNLAKALRDTKGVSIEKGKAVEYDAESRAIKKKAADAKAETEMDAGSEYAMASKTQPGKLDPRTITEADVREMLENVKSEKYYEDTYIPVRINTPETLIYWAKNKLNDVIDNAPIAMEVGKAYQAMAQKRLDDGSTPHKLSVDDMIAIIKNMNDPRYIVYQKNNGRYVEVIPYQLADKKKAFAVMEMGNHKNAVHMNGYEGGLYNIYVTSYNPNPGKLQETLNNKNNIVVYDKQKDGSQRTSGSMVPSVLNDSPFYDSIIPQTDPDVNSEFSFATDEQLRKQAIKMLQEGISAKQVYEETGFFIDDKGRIRNDTDDADGSDPAIRKPYPVENLKRVKAEAEAKLEAERDMAKLRALRSENAALRKDVDKWKRRAAAAESAVRTMEKDWRASKERNLSADKIYHFSMSSRAIIRCITLKEQGIYSI